MSHSVENGDYCDSEGNNLEDFWEKNEHELINTLKPTRGQHDFFFFFF